MEFKHKPVMLDECINGLNIKPDGIYVDGTLGGAGHSKQIVKKLNENGIIQKGLIIRHLILPNENQNTKNVLKWIKENIDDEVYISIMAQYFPTYKAKEIKELSRKINIKEYEDIEDYIYEIGIENGYMQDLGEHEEEYVPEFKNSLT